ncbi:hypothetical protein L2E82_42887 [Cichorium intybus]|uniref:Uncharacterized protein n=1 Tax=Cichorium intybus TaxID=13427 RepID=A0ACB8ZS56_CICIN|nr:hypothetical protein L2E82_42887 [Cichorium intybus]
MTIQAPALRHHPIRYSVTIRLASRVELPKKASDVNVHQERLTRIAEMEDLQAPREHPDPRDYFDSQQVNAMNELAGRRHLKSRMNTCQAYGSLRGFISEIRSLGLSDPVVRPEVDVKVFNGLTQTISSSKYQLGKNPHENILYTLPTVTKDELLLVSRLKDAMSQIYTKLQEIKESVQSDSMHHVSLLVQPMLQPLDAAFAHYDEDQHKRSAQAIDKPPNGYGYDLQPADIQNIRLTYSDLCTWVPESKFRECLLATLAVPFQLMCSYHAIMNFSSNKKALQVPTLLTHQQGLDICSPTQESSKP